MAAELIGLLIYLTPVFLVILAWITGSWLESRHYRDIREREARFAKTPCVNGKTLSDGNAIIYARLALGSVVISIDHFKRFLAGLRTIFGGELRAYSSLIDRARREAILRMKEQSPNADLFLNVRLETATISSGREKQTGTVEVVAYGTAIKFKRDRA